MAPRGGSDIEIVRENPQDSATPPPARRSRRGVAILGIAVLILGVGIYFGIRSRVNAETRLAETTTEDAVPTVNIIHPTAGAPNEEIVLPGNVQAFTDTPIYARTSGYLHTWYFDIGAHVKAGDLLAEIETPEVDEQLRQARADLATAEANLQLADITAKRNEDLLKTRSIATQDRDNAVGTAAADKAIVASRQADVSRLERLQSYEKVYAPFDGVVTARNTDVGALIDAGANAPGRELFHLSAIDKVRIFVAVPEAYSRAVATGAEANVTLDEYPGENFSGTLVRTTDAIDPTSRTLMVEVDVANQDSQLLPGAYALVHLSLPSATQTVTVPSNALLFRREGLQVAVVRDGQAQLQPIKIGRDYGDRVEVVSGLQPSDDIILDPSDSLISGTAVHVAQPTMVGSAQ
jgi:RND family efflux transporter MFP subunit